MSSKRKFSQAHIPLIQDREILESILCIWFTFLQVDILIWKRNNYCQNKAERVTVVLVVSFEGGGDGGDAGVGGAGGGDGGGVSAVVRLNK